MRGQAEAAHTFHAAGGSQTFRQLQTALGLKALLVLLKIAGCLLLFRGYFKPCYLVQDLR